MMWQGIPREVPFKLRRGSAGVNQIGAVIQVTAGSLGVYDPPGRLSYFTCITRTPGVHVNGCHQKQHVALTRVTSPCSSG